MTTPLYFDNFCLRFNSNLQALEYNSGNEVWVPVPVPTGDLGLTNGKILVGNASNLAAAVTMSGGATIANTGVLTLNDSGKLSNTLTTLHTFAGVAGVATDTSVLQVDVTHTSVGINQTPVTDGSNALGVTGGIQSSTDIVALRYIYGIQATFSPVYSVGGSQGLTFRPSADSANGVVWQNASQVTAMSLDTTNKQLVMVGTPKFPTASVNGTGTITPNAYSQSTLIVNVSGATTINGPTNGYDGQKLTFRIVNDGSHSVALATGSGNFSYGTTVTGYTNSASTIDYIGVIYDLANTIWHVVSLAQGY